MAPVRLRPALTLLLLSAGSVAAAEPLVFKGPEVAKVDWATRALRAADIDGDGFQDLALINNDLAKIDLLFQVPEGASREQRLQRVSENRWNPLLEDARFDRSSVSVGFTMYDLAVGDLNGDGRADLAYTSSEDPLTVRLQDSGGLWKAPLVFDAAEPLGWIGTLALDDLNGDGSNELVMLGEGELCVLDTDADGEFKEPATFFLTGENPFNLLVVDVDGDGLKDLLYITHSGKYSLVWRRQLQDLEFGPEFRFEFEAPVRLVSWLQGFPSDRPQFASLVARTGAIAMFHLEQAAAPPAGTGQMSLPRVYPLFHDAREPTRYGGGDFNGDGALDMLAANPAVPELVYLESTAEGFTAPTHFPAYDGIAAIETGDFAGDGQLAAVVLSVEEKLLGVSRFDADARFTFPETVPLGSAEPLAFTVSDLDRNGKSELLVIVSEDGQLILRVLEQSTSATGAIWQVMGESELPETRRVPSALRQVNLFGDEGHGLVVFVPREEALLLRSTTDEPFLFDSFAAESSVRKSLMKDLKPAGLSVFDLNGDGRDELIVCKTGFARALAVESDDLVMVEQFNSRQAVDAIDLLMPVFDPDGALIAIDLYVEAQGELQRLTRDEDAVFRFAESLRTGSMEVVGAMPRVGAGGEVAILGSDRFWVMPPEGKASWSVVIDDSFETDLEGFTPRMLAGASFDPAAAYNLLAVDPQSHLLEILGLRDGSWESRIYWRIFDESLNYQGRGGGGGAEPREMRVGDFSGDGRDDFVFLVHDRVLLYISVPE